MEFLSDPVILARIQFAFTAMYHFFAGARFNWPWSDCGNL